MGKCTEHLQAQHVQVFGILVRRKRNFSESHTPPGSCTGQYTHYHAFFLARMVMRNASCPKKRGTCNTVTPSTARSIQVKNGRLHHKATSIDVAAPPAIFARSTRSAWARTGVTKCKTFDQKAKLHRKDPKPQHRDLSMPPSVREGVQIGQVKALAQVFGTSLQAVLKLNSCAQAQP